MAHVLTHVLINGYVIDWGSLARLLLALGTVYYLRVFGRRTDAGVYQAKTREATFAFLALVPIVEFSIAAFGGTPVLFMLRDIGKLGAAFTVFQINRKIREYASAAFFVLGVGGVAIVNVAGMDVDIVLAASMILVYLALFDFYAYSKSAGYGRVKSYALRGLFLLSLLTSYVFAFTGALLGADLFFFEEVSELIALLIGFLSVRAAVGTRPLTAA